MTNRTKGIEGENIAADFLHSKGWHIIETNWKAERCEIDIIAREGSTIVFVEVKLRNGAQYGWPEDAVTPAKQRNIADAAETYLEIKKLDMEIRFDIVSIIMKDGKPEIYHIRDAFAPDGDED